jgi:hypothetical protein
MKKFLKIKDTAKFIYFKNRKVRTPATLEVTDDDLKNLHIALRMSDIQNFEIVLEDEYEKEEKVEIVIDENKNVIIEELEAEEDSSTILEELMRNGEKI